MCVKFHIVCKSQELNNWCSLCLNIFVSSKVNMEETETSTNLKLAYNEWIYNSLGENKEPLGVVKSESGTKYKFQHVHDVLDKDLFKQFVVNQIRNIHDNESDIENMELKKQKMNELLEEASNSLTIMDSVIHSPTEENNTFYSVAVLVLTNKTLKDLYFSQLFGGISLSAEESIDLKNYFKREKNQITGIIYDNGYDSYWEEVNESYQKISNSQLFMDRNTFFIDENNPLVKFLIRNFKWGFGSGGEQSVCHAKVFRYKTNDIAKSREVFAEYLSRTKRLDNQRIINDRGTLMGSETNSARRLKLENDLNTPLELQMFEFCLANERVGMVREKLYSVSEVTDSGNQIEFVQFVHPIPGFDKKTMNKLIEQIVKDFDVNAVLNGCGWFVDGDVNEEDDSCKATFSKRYYANDFDTSEGGIAEYIDSDAIGGIRKEMEE